MLLLLAHLAGRSLSQICRSCLTAAGQRAILMPAMRSQSRQVVAISLMLLLLLLLAIPVARGQPVFSGVSIYEHSKPPADELRGRVAEFIAALSYAYPHNCQQAAQELLAMREQARPQVGGMIRKL